MRGRNGKKPDPPVHDDLVERDFTADNPNELWLSDITEHWTDEGKLYFARSKMSALGGSSATASTPAGNHVSPSVRSPAAVTTSRVVLVTPTKVLNFNPAHSCRR